MGRRTWFFLLIILIIILYCISWRPAICGERHSFRPDTLKSQQPSPAVTAATNAVNTTPDPYEYQTDLLKNPPNESLSATLFGSQQRIPRPEGTELRPFGCDIFGDSAQGFATVDQLMAPEDYTLGPGDHLLLNVWGRVDLSLDLIVDREGKIFIPRAGEVIVHGTTLAQAEKRIGEALETVYSNFELNLMLGRLRSMAIFVFGEVRRPGAYTVSSLTTVFNALYHAGGPNERGSLRHIRLMRGNRTVKEIDFYDFLLSGRRGKDPRLQPGDVVFVPVVGPRVTIRGEVKRPGVYELKNNERLTSLFALAGGATAEAYLERVMIDRIAERDGRCLLDIDYTAASANGTKDIALVDGDDVSVFSIFDIRPNIVWLEGAVRRPGAFERFDSMTVYDLIGGGSQLKPDAYTKRADLERTGPKGSLELTPVNLEALCGGEGEADILLKDGDRLIVYDRDKIVRRPQVFIDGLVKYPGQYELLGSMRLSDLIFRAGSLSKNAYLVRAEIARHRPGVTTQLITVDLRDVTIRQDLSQDILLEEDDQVFIREAPQGTDFPLVSITGEVRFPGNYALLGPSETLRELIERSGGLTPRAFPEGTIFTRQKISEDLRRQGLEHILLHSQPIVKDSSGGYVRQELLQFDADAMTRIVLDVPAILKNRSEDDDITLQDGDRIYIPEIPSGIQLMGAVASPGTIKFHAGWKAGKYIKEGGGLTSVANKSELRLIRANGQVISGRPAIRRRVQLGDAIFAPPKIKKETNWLQYITGTASILTSVATTWFLIDRIADQ